MRVVRAELDDGTRVVGVRYPAWLLGDVLTAVLTAPHLQKLAADDDIAIVSEVDAPTEVRSKALERATAPPRTILSFFKPNAGSGSAGAGTGRGAQPGGRQSGDGEEADHDRAGDDQPDAPQAHLRVVHTTE